MFQNNLNLTDPTFEKRLQVLLAQLLAVIDIPGDLEPVLVVMPQKHDRRHYPHPVGSLPERQLDLERVALPEALAGQLVGLVRRKEVQQDGGQSLLELLPAERLAGTPITEFRDGPAGLDAAQVAVVLVGVQRVQVLLVVVELEESPVRLDLGGGVVRDRLRHRGLFFS